ncbi:MAG: hypothetical protein OEZ58_18220 [Gammaproteobacteria bacterium]|nr:hypothetical protein [Gammaproteobacteria bacterium]
METENSKLIYAVSSGTIADASEQITMNLEKATEKSLLSADDFYIVQTEPQEKAS